MLIVVGEVWRKRDERESDEKQNMLEKYKNKFELTLWGGSMKYENITHTQKYTQTHTSMRTVCFGLKLRRFGRYQTLQSMHRQYFSAVNIFQEWIFSKSEYFSAVNISLGYFLGVNIFQEWIFFKSEYFSRVNIFQEWIFLGVNFFFQGLNIFQGWIFSAMNNS